MTARLSARLAPLALVLAPVLAILAARLATHSELAARHPRTAALLFLWVAADALTLALIAKAPHNRPGVRAMLSTLAAGCIVATLSAADPVRSALFDMHGVVLAMGLTVALALGWNLGRAGRAYARSRSIEAAASEVLPENLVKFIAFESAMTRLALLSWGAKADVPQGAMGFAYHRVINPLIATFLVLQLIEILVVDLLVSHWSKTAAWLLLALGVWGVIFLVALMKAFRLHPVLIDGRAVRVRAGTLIKLTVPIDAIADIAPSVTREELRHSAMLDAALLSYPNVILRLARPLEYRPRFGKPRRVESVAFRLDDPAPFLAELRARLQSGEHG